MNEKQNNKIPGIKNLSDPELRATRMGYGEALMELGELNKDVVVLTADLAESTRVLDFAKKYPERFIECGVAEQNMAGIAAGLAACGKIPFISSYAVFSPGRNWDQIRVSICYSNLNVKIIGAHTGVSVGPDGATHQALEDIALMRVLPNMQVVVPCDAVQARQTIKAISSMTGPMYVRLTREKTPIILDENSRFEIGKIQTLWETGTDVVIFACGPLVYQSLVAAKELHEEGINITVANNHTVKPLDSEGIVNLAKTCKKVVCVEEHQIVGGMGSAIAELLSAKHPAPIEFVGMPDTFGQSGRPEELLETYGMSVVKIKAAVKRVMLRR